jgi:hypothetical protein
MRFSTKAKVCICIVSLVWLVVCCVIGRPYYLDYVGKRHMRELGALFSEFDEPFTEALFLDETIVGEEGVRIDDAEFEYIAGHFAYLQILDASHTRITDEGLRHIARLKHLQTLGLNGRPITDDGLKTIGKMTGLRRLSLNNTQITDAGLVHLRGLKHLVRLEVMHTEVTVEAAAKLEAAIGGEFVVATTP